MIDTDKYEGHLIDKAVEDNSQVWVWKNWMLKNAETIEQHKATAALLSDAPLLLAEVERLRKAIVDVIDSMDNYYIRDIQHATECLRDVIGYYEDDEE